MTWPAWQIYKIFQFIDFFAFQKLWCQFLFLDSHIHIQPKIISLFIYSSGKRKQAACTVLLPAGRNLGSPFQPASQCTSKYEPWKGEVLASRVRESMRLRRARTVTEHGWSSAIPFLPCSALHGMEITFLHSKVTWKKKKKKKLLPLGCCLGTAVMKNWGHTASYMGMKSGCTDHPLWSAW